MAVLFSTATNCFRDRNVVQFWQMRNNECFLGEFLENFSLLLRDLWEEMTPLDVVLGIVAPFSYQPDSKVNTNCSET